MLKKSKQTALIIVDYYGLISRGVSNGAKGTISPATPLNQGMVLSYEPSPRGGKASFRYLLPVYMVIPHLHTVREYF